MPKVSMIIATHSRPKLLPRAVKSAQAAGTDVEVVVVDDASTDETAEVCQKLQGITYVRVERNQQTAGARNIGLMVSSAPYVGFLDDDDWRLPGSLDRQVDLLDANPDCGLAYGRYALADQNGRLLDEDPIPQRCPSGDVFWQVLSSNIFGCLTAVFRSECITRVGLLDATIPGIDDWDLWVRISELYAVAALEETVAVWTKPAPSSGQGSSDEMKLWILADRAYRKKWLRLPRVTKEFGDHATWKHRAFLRGNAERMLCDILFKTPSKKDQYKKLAKLVRRHPDRFLDLNFHKTIVKGVLLNRSG